MAIALAAAVVALYLKTVHFSFVNMDDAMYTTNHQVVRGLSFAGSLWAIQNTDGYWQPITWISHMLDFEVFGADPGPHHFSSVVIQALAASLLLVVLSQMTKQVYRSALVAAVWAMHPLRVESVAWVAERKDVLSGLFGVATIGAWSWYTARPCGKRYLVVAVLLASALMCKPTVVALPLLLILIDFWPLQRQVHWKQRIREQAPLFAMAISVAIVTEVCQRRSGALSLVAASPVSRVQNAITAIGEYLGKTVWPSPLVCFYPYPTAFSVLDIAACATLILGMSIIAIWRRSQQPYLLVGWFWFLATLVPVLGLVQAGRQGMADRFTYWPMIGLLIAIVWLVADAFPRISSPWGSKLCAVALLILLCATSWRQIDHWRDSTTLFEHALAHGPDNDYMRGLLATTFIEQGQYDQAEGNLLVATKLAPLAFEHHHNLGLVLLRKGQLDGAWEEAKLAETLAPREAAVHEQLAAVSAARNQYAVTAREYESAVGLGYSANSAASRLNDLGASAAEKGEFGAAQTLLETAVRVEPTLIAARKNLILVFLSTGRSREAARSLKAAFLAVGSSPVLEQMKEHIPALAEDSDP